MRSIVSTEREDEFTTPVTAEDTRVMRLCAELLRRHGGVGTELEQEPVVNTRLTELEGNLE